MSYTTVYGIRFGEAAEEAATLKNSWGSAPVIWDTLCKKWLGRDSWLSDNQDLWNLALDARLPEYERALLAMTFDRSYVSAENIDKAIGHVREWLANHKEDPDRVNHWPAIIDIMIDLDAKNQGIAFHMTSVSADDYWEGEWDEEKEENASVNWDLTLEVYDYIER